MAILKIINGKYKSFGSIARVVRYVTREEATSSDLIYSNYCSNDPEEIIRTMKQNKETWHKTGGTQLHHEVISFPAGSITPEQAAEFGRDYGYKVYGTKYHWMSAVHTDKDCIHIHFVVDSVSVETGKKYNSRPEVLEKKRHLVSDICAYRHMPIAIKGLDAWGNSLPEGHVTSYDRGTYETRLDKERQQGSWKYQLYKAVNDAKSQAVSIDDFKKRLTAQGYRYEVRGKSLVFYEIENSQHRMRATTLSSTFHVDFTTDGLEQAFIKNELEDRLSHCQVLYVKLTPEIRQTKQVTLMTIKNNDALFSLLDCMPSGAAKRDLYLIIETVEALHALFKLIIDIIDKQYTANLHTVSLDEHKANKNTYRGTKKDAFDAYCFGERMSHSLNTEGPVLNKQATNVERTPERKRIIRSSIDENERDDR